MTEFILNTAAEVFDALRLSRSDLFGDEPLSKWVFRGHRDRDWRLVPGVWREGFLEQFSATESSVLQDTATSHPLSSLEWMVGTNVVLIRRRSEVIKRCLVAFQLWRNFAVLAEDALIVELDTEGRTFWDYAANLHTHLLSTPGNEVALAQHYGVPTRLLDFSSDPLTALFFALPTNPVGTAKGVVWAVRAEDTSAHPASAALRWKRMATSLWDKRMSAQRSVFSYIENGERTYMKTGDYPSVDALADPDNVHKFLLNLSIEEVRKLTIGLLRERRSQAHLMPDLGAASDVGTMLHRFGIHL